MSSAAKPTLHHLESSQSLRILWALEELQELYGTEYNLIVYNRSTKASKDMLEVSSLGFSPILTVPKPNAVSESDRVVKTESRLILNYLHDNFGRGIWEPAREDAERDEFFQEFAQNTVNARVGFVLAFDIVPQSIPLYLLPIKLLFTLTYFPTSYFFKSNYLPRVFQYMEDALTAEKPWFSGMKMGKADILMTFPIDMARQRGYLDSKKFPKIAVWHDSCLSRPARQRALQKGGRYNLVDFFGGAEHFELQPTS